MDREILFRGKRLDNGEWIYGFVIHAQEDDSWGITNEIEYFNDVDGYTVGQYTGLTDKNGVKIFEGDIVQTKYGRLCIVDWFESNSTLCFDFRPIDIAENLLKKAPDKWDLWHEANLEVIGNIHDNPDLLIDRRAD